MIKVESIGFSYPGKQVLKDVSFDLTKGETLGVIGPNGGGKSTLLKLILGLLKPSCGKINIESTRISFVPQKQSLNSTLPLKVKDYIKLGLINSSDSYELKDVLERVGLTDKSKYQMSELSGGEKQRALLAKALISKPEILVLDEPTTALDGQGQDQLLSLLSKLKTDINITLVMVDHHIDQITKNCDKILCLNKTHHWHDHSHKLDKNVLQKIYHCEFEHLKLHSEHGPSEDHTHCAQDHGHDHSPKSHSHKDDSKRDQS